jgi:glycine cleavage system H protein
MAVALPEDLLYTAEHEWVQEIGAVGTTVTVRVGITDFAQDALGDVVYVQLPEIGEEFALGDSFGEVESTKSVSDLYAPLSGKVVAVNEALGDASELVNSAPYAEGWLVELEVDGEADRDHLLTPAAYAQKIAG